MIFNKKSKSTKEKLFPFESLNDSKLKYIPAAMIVYYSIWGNKYFKIIMLLDEYGIIDTKKAFNYITTHIIKELKTHVLDKNDINTRINQLIKQYATKENKKDEKITIEIEDNTSSNSHEEDELLKSWHKLVEDGIITEDEFETKKKKIISDKD